MKIATITKSCTSVQLPLQWPATPETASPVPRRTTSLAASTYLWPCMRARPLPVQPAARVWHRVQRACAAGVTVVAMCQYRFASWRRSGSRSLGSHSTSLGVIGSCPVKSGRLCVTQGRAYALYISALGVLRTAPQAVKVEVSVPGGHRCRDGGLS